MRSLFQMMKIDLPVPDHSTLSKRGKTLKVKLPKKADSSLNLVLDGTGLKIYGEGDWKVRKHGYSTPKPFLSDNKRFRDSCRSGKLMNYSRRTPNCTVSIGWPYCKNGEDKFDILASK